MIGKHIIFLSKKSEGKVDDMPSLSSQYPDVFFYNPLLTEVQEDVIIGRGTRVGSFTLLHAGAAIGVDCTIGSHCNICRCEIGANVSIQTASHITRGTKVEDDVFIGPGVITLNDTLKNEELQAPVIMRGARIGGGSLILPGVIIGENALVGAGSVVTRDIASGSCFVGNPARAHTFGGRT
jgi:UDP-2-acetamido-3-amino-2,3-dideoxy-glucuronate N-acetyltransferase